MAITLLLCVLVVWVSEGEKNVDNFRNVDQATSRGEKRKKNKTEKFDKNFADELATR